MFDEILSTKVEVTEKQARAGESNPQAERNPLVRELGPGDFFMNLVQAKFYLSPEKGKSFFLTFARVDDGSKYTMLFFPEIAQARKNSKTGAVIRTMQQAKDEQFQMLKKALAACVGLSNARANELTDAQLQDLFAGKAETVTVRIRNKVKDSGWVDTYVDPATKAPATPVVAAPVVDMPAAPSVPGEAPVLSLEDRLQAFGLKQHPANPAYWFNPSTNEVKKAVDWAV